MDSIADWNFDKGATGRWTWSYIEPTAGYETRCSLQTFPSLVECMNDAARHGYRSDSHSAPVRAAATEVKSRPRRGRGKTSPGT